MGERGSTSVRLTSEVIHMEHSVPENFISPAVLDRLIAAHDGDVALLYLYRVRTGTLDAERAARDLCRTRREIDAADEKLTRLTQGGVAGEFSPAAASASAATADAEINAGRAVGASARESAPQAPEDTLPEYRAAELARRSREDERFAAILAEAQRVMGRALSSVDMKTLFGIYDYLALPADVIMLLINHVGKQYSERYGTSRRPSARALEKEAYRWANREILTLEQAEDYIRALAARKTALAEAKEAMGIAGRELTKTETEYISSWLDMGYDAQSIAIAYDRTVTNTGALRWSYMNKIISSWRDSGLFTPEEIEQKDPRRRGDARKVKVEPRGSRPSDFDGLDAMLDKI